MTTPELLDTVTLFRTPEQAAYRYRVAGPLVRSLAFLIDALVVVVLLVVGWLLLAMVGMVTGLGGLAVGLAFGLTFLLLWLAGAIVEWRWRGRTPGKALLGLRTVTSEGLPPGLAATTLRTLLRYADALPTVAMAAVTMVCSRDFRRLGDLAAGTLVVHDGEDPAARRTSLTAAPSERALEATLPAEVGLLVDPPALRAIATYLARRRDFHEARRMELASHLAAPLARRLGLPMATDPDRLLAAVHHRLTASVDDQALARGAAFLARREGAWSRLDALARGVVPGDRVRESPALAFARLYRSACADLSLAEALHLPHRTVDRLHRVVARAHLGFHPPVPTSWADLRRLVLEVIPGRLYGDPCLRAALLAFFGTFCLCIILAALRPGTAEAVMGPGFVDQLRDMYRNHPSGRNAEEAALMHGFYLMHNVGIALACFAAGVFAGVGSLIFLAFNGVVLGLAFGAMLTVDDATRGHFFEFVTAHGPFELTGIALAGAAGLRLGLGIIDTGGLPRLDSLRRAAGRAVPIIAVAAFSVALAAPIEAWVSPSTVPLGLKRAVAVASTLLLIGYLVVLGARARSGDVDGR